MKVNVRQIEMSQMSPIDKVMVVERIRPKNYEKMFE